MSPISITRENQSCLITVNAGSVPGKSITDIQSGNRSFRKNPQDPAVRIEYGGDFEDLMKAIKQFVVIIIMAIACFAVGEPVRVAADPFIVLFTMPLVVVGIVAIYAITGLPLNVMTAVGVLIPWESS